MKSFMWARWDAAQVPFQNPISCGNYTFMDFDSSKQACVNFLNLITAGKLEFEYPYIEEN